MSARNLTDDEIALAKTVFGDSIDYGAVKIHDRKYIFAQNRHTAMAPNGHLYMGAKLRSPDYAREDVYKQALFLHEMTHVWQFQNKILNPVSSGAKLMIKHGFNYRAAYSYKLDPQKDLLDYNMEQQASIVEDYFLHQRCGLSHWQGNCQDEEVGSFKNALYEKVLEKFLKNPGYARRPAFKPGPRKLG